MIVLIDPSGSKIQQTVAPSLPSSYNDRFPGTPVDGEGGPCTEAARRKTQVIVSDVASDAQWDSYGWRTAALTHGLKVCSSTTILASNGLVLGTVAIYWREPRSPTEGDQKIIEQITHLASVAFEQKRNEAALQESEERFRRIVDTIPGFVCTLSAEGVVELLNRQVLEYFGKTTEELKLTLAFTGPRSLSLDTLLGHNLSGTLWGAAALFVGALGGVVALVQRRAVQTPQSATGE